MNRLIKILFLAANPKDTSQLRLDEEMRGIDQALRQSEFRDKFDLKQQWAVRVADLQSHLLRHKPDIVHFSGHGSLSSEVILEDNDGNSKPIPSHALSQLFFVLKDNIQCVVLNACYSKEQAQAIAQHINCVIGMSKAIGDSAAINFSVAFYQALGFGRDVRTAFDLGCLQINLESLNEQDTPKLIALKSNPKKIAFVKEVEVENIKNAAVTRILREAIRAVPAVKYALGIAGIISALAIVVSFQIDFRVAILGTIIMLILMVVLVIFARLTVITQSYFVVPAIVLTWFCLLITISTATLLFSSVFFQNPLNLEHWLNGNSNSSFNGTVLLDEKPIGGAEVKILEIEKSRLTNEFGKFEITIAENDLRENYTFVVSYNEVDTTVIVSSADRKDLYFDLKTSKKSISGIILDYDNHKISGVELSISGTSEKTYSNSSGLFFLEIKDRTATRLELIASKMGYKTKQFFIIVPDSNVKILLEKTQ